MTVYNGSTSGQNTTYSLTRIQAQIPVDPSRPRASPTPTSIPGILIGSSNGFFTDLIGELSDVGIRVTGNYNNLCNCRGTSTPGRAGGSPATWNAFAACSQVANGQAAVSTYCGAKVSGTGNSFAAFKGNGAMVKWHIEDLVGPPAARPATTTTWAARAGTPPPHRKCAYSAATTVTTLRWRRQCQSLTHQATAAVPITLANSGSSSAQTDEPGSIVRRAGDLPPDAQPGVGG